MDEFKLMPELPSAAASAVPDAFPDAPAHAVVSEGEFAPRGLRDVGVGLHGGEPVLSVPFVGEEAVGCQFLTRRHQICTTFTARSESAKCQH